jgi:hypothetical protein
MGLGIKTRLRQAVTGSAPYRELAEHLRRIEIAGRIQAAFARAAATKARTIDLADPATWEFAGFSQHGEDGIVDHLCTVMAAPNQTFVEIGAADGLENCSAWLALARSYGGLMVEGDPTLAATAREVYEGQYRRSWNVFPRQAFVTTESLPGLLRMCPCPDPDVFSLDIDGIDYWIASKVLELGYRPRICVVEFNSAFGPERPVTVPYRPNFARWSAHVSGLYYGVSIAAYRRLFEGHGYQFVTVERSGTNAFFVDPAHFPEGFACGLKRVGFRENTSDCNGATKPRRDADGHEVVPRRDWSTQSALIAGLDLVDV